MMKGGTVSPSIRYGAEKEEKIRSTKKTPVLEKLNST
jgi:hypothetical protein